MPSSLPWPRGRRGLASRSRWKPCTFFTSRRAFLKNQPSYCLPPDSAEPGRLLLPPSQILSPGTPTRHRHFSSKARSFTARGPFRLGTGTLARTPKKQNPPRRVLEFSSCPSWLGQAGNREDDSCTRHGSHRHTQHSRREQRPQRPWRKRFSCGSLS